MAKYKILCTLNQARVVAGTEKHLLILLKNLNRDLFDPAVVCFSDGPLIELLRKQGIKAWSLNRERFLDYSTARRLYSLIKEYKFDLLHSHCGQFACIIAKLAGVPYLIETRHGLYLNYDQLNKVSFLRSLINKRKATFVDLTLTVNEIDKKLLIETFRAPKNKIRGVANGLDLEEIQSLEINSTQIKHKLQIASSCNIVGTVARFTEQKGLKYFVQAIKLIKEQIPNCKFIIVGDGELKNSLINSVKNIGVYQDVIFTGYRVDAVSLMSIFDIFVLPSLWEGMPYTILEAMALKKPVVATNVFGNSEIILNGITGNLVPPRDSLAISEAVIRLLKDKEKAKEMGENGFRRVKKNFSAKKMTEKIEQTYLELLNGFK